MIFVAAFTHVANVSALTGDNPASCGTSTRFCRPSNRSAFEFTPLVQIGNGLPCNVPACPFPDTSAVFVPTPSSKGQWPTSPSCWARTSHARVTTIVNVPANIALDFIFIIGLLINKPDTRVGLTSCWAG